MSIKINLFQSVKSFVNAKKVGDTFTTREFHIAMSSIEQTTWWKRMNNNQFYRSNTYRTYLKRLGFLEIVRRGLWKVKCHVPEWLDSGHVNSYLGYTYEARSCHMPSKHATYKGMTRDEIMTKIKTHIADNCVSTIKEAPKQEVDHLAEYQKQHKLNVTRLAMNIIGDGKSPNVWFVTQSSYFMRYKDGYGESILLEGCDESESSPMFGPFFSYSDACAKYDEIELDPQNGIGTVTIEDRVMGVVREKYSSETITVTYDYDEIDDSNFYSAK